MQQAVDLTTGEQVAIKFIERSQEVRARAPDFAAKGCRTPKQRGQSKPRCIGGPAGAVPAVYSTGCDLCAVRAAAFGVSPLWTAPVQVSKYVEREILNHKRLIHPHIVQLKEVSNLPELNKVALHACLESGAQLLGLSAEG